jgi:23S rRNA (adenine2030-N6)-methyltransferase
LANRHFGEIGDVWKHLLLAGILDPLVPAWYLDAHAGSAFYPLTPTSPERDYGIGRFREEASRSPVLARCAYRRVQLDARWQAAYPGSPAIAMSLLGAETTFVFCDTDEASLETIGGLAEVLGENVEADRLMLVARDGLASVEDLLAGMDDDEASTGIVFLDPYDPFAVGETGRDAFRTFAAAAARGALSILWAGWDDPAGRERVRAAVGRALRKERVGSAVAYEMELAGIDDPGFTANPGVRGCAMVVAGLDPSLHGALEALAEACVEIYRDAWLPSGEPGAIRHARADLGASG